MTIWRYRIFVFQKDTELANAFWTVVAPQGDPERLTFTGVRLSEDGLEPAAWRGANTAATEEMKLLMGQFAPELPDMAYYVLNSDGVLIEAHNGEAETGQPWSWEQALDDLSLELIQEATAGGP